MKNYTKKIHHQGGTYYTNERNKYHRLDGPAIYWPDFIGNRFYINGIYYTEKEYQKHPDVLKYKQMKEAKELLGIKDV